MVDYYAGFIELDVYFPPLKPLKREILKEWVKVLPDDRVTSVRFNEDNTRAGVELKTSTGRRIYYVFDKGRIMSFDLSEVPKRHKNKVERLLMKFIPERGQNRLIKRTFRVETPHYADLIKTYFEWNTYHKLAEVWRLEVVKKAYSRKTGADEEKIIPVRSPDHEEPTGFREVQKLELEDHRLWREKKEVFPRFYLDSIEILTKNRRNSYIFVIGSRNIFLNWEWWKRPDVGLFFI